MTQDEKNEQGKEVHAYAGLALYWAQCFEMTLENFLMLHARLFDSAITLSALECYEQQIQRKTLGGLIQEARARVTVDDGVEAMISDALEKRNFLAHRFFKERSIDALSEHGRDRLISELQEYRLRFQEADVAATALCGLLMDILGITDEMVAAEMKKTAEGRNAA